MEETRDRIQLASDEDNERSHSFRDRRLTYTKLNHDAASAAADFDDSNDDDESNENTEESAEGKEPKGESRKRKNNIGGDSKDATLKRHNIKLNAKGKALTSRVVHASEIDQRVHGGVTKAKKEEPAWKRRRHVCFTIDDNPSILPFSRDVVGTYSCHGVEPLYEDDEDEDTDDAVDVTSDDEETGTIVAKINQDRGGVAFPYGHSLKTALFAAYDGHGDGGELVSQFALYEVQHRLEKHASFNTDIEKAFKETFISVDESLKTEPDIEPLFAGATACAALLRDNKLIVANCGDSRAVIASRVKEGGKENFMAHDLTVDQNPDSPGEQERIEQAGGFVSPAPEPGLSARVWVDKKLTQIGLAMSRSIGDHAVKPLGVIAEPVVTQHELSDQDEFFIIATDGVWEFIESQEAVDLVAEHLAKGEGSSKACQALIEAAAERWHEQEGFYRDDITALVIRLKELWKNE
mmetsp:Transcript_16762/g.30464  ORF Transcript_16762/g.30464 Transcript_16762/m.30464 type:complete len:465 (-) Transcript_16762:78-1472(-)